MKKEYNLKKMKEIPNPYKGKLKKNIRINLSTMVIDYFKKMSKEINLPYQQLIDMYLLDCVIKKRRLSIKWTSKS